MRRFGSARLPRPGPGLAAGRALGLVRAPRAVRQVPEEGDEGGRDEGGGGEAAAGLGPPAAFGGGEEGEPAAAAGAGGGPRALPRHQVEGDLAGGGGEEHGEGERDEPDEDAVEAHGAAAPAGGGRAHPVGEVDDHERQEQQPQGAGAVAGGEVGPDVRLGDGTVAEPVGPALGVRVVGAAVHGGRAVPGDTDGAGVVEHALRGGSADAVHEEFERGGGAPRLRVCAGCGFRCGGGHGVPSCGELVKAGHGSGGAGDGGGGVAGEDGGGVAAGGGGRWAVPGRCPRRVRPARERRCSAAGAVACGGACGWGCATCRGRRLRAGRRTAHP